MLPQVRHSTSLEVTVAYGTRSIAKLAYLLTGSRLNAAAKSDSVAITDDDTILACRLVRDQLHASDKQVQAVKDGIVHIAYSLLRGAVQNDGVRYEAAMILETLFRTAAARVAVAALAAEQQQSGGDPLEAIAQLASDDTSSKVRSAIAALLHTLSGTRIGVAEIVGRPAVVQALVRACEVDPATTAQLALVGTVVNVAAAGHSGVDTLLNSGAVPALASILSSAAATQRLPASGSIPLECLLALRCLVGEGGDAGKEAVLAARAVPLLFGYLSSQDPKTRLAAIGCIASLAIYIPAKRACLDLGPDVYVPPIVALLRSGDASGHGDDQEAGDQGRMTSATAAIAIRHLSEVPDGRGSMLAALLRHPPSVQRVFGPSACADLLHLVGSQRTSQHDRALALEALCLICGVGLPTPATPTAAPRDRSGDGQAVDGGNNLDAASPSSSASSSSSLSSAAVGREALCNTVNVIDTLVCMSAAHWSDGSGLAVKDRAGRLISYPIHAMAVGLVKAIGTHARGAGMSIRQAYARIGVPCTLLDDDAAAPGGTR